MPEKECPWCTIFLVVMALLCHIAVLAGNYQAANGFHTMGVSTTGWSHVGRGLARALKEELNMQMGNVTQVLTDGIDQLMVAQDSMDTALGSMGDATEAALQQHRYHKDVVYLSRESSDAIVSQLGTQIPDSVNKITTAADSLLDMLEPALLLIGKWETTFGDKLQAGVEMFGTAVDLVQKLFDQVMSQINGGGGPDPYMEENTYTLFALTDKAKGITVQDLKDVSGIYSITALQGDKAEEMHGKYDLNKDAYIDADEYEAFVLDSSMPFIMSVVLRTYSSRLSAVAGSTRSARMRDEVANALVKYLQLVAAKNLTKVGWIADLLGNGTLPMEFTADVMKNLAQVADDPEALTTCDVGATVVGVMSLLHADYTMDAANLMADTDFWVSEGFDPADQPACVDKVTEWMGTSFLQTGSVVHLRNLHGMLNPDMSDTSTIDVVKSSRKGGGSSELAVASLDVHQFMQTGVKSAHMLGAMGRQLAKRNRAIYLRRRNEALVARYQEIHKTPAARSLFNTLLGGAMASRADPSAAAAVNSGVPAANITLTFMSWLANNATKNAQIFQEASFNYSSQSSNAMDAFATKVHGLVKKFQAFLNLMEDFSGETGVARLRDKVKEFSEKGQGELTNAILLYLRSSEEGSLKQMQDPTDASPDAAIPDNAESFAALATTLEIMQSVLPVCIQNLKLARDVVAQTDSMLDSVFDVFEEKGRQIFDDIAYNYKLAWTAYFVLFFLITLGIMYYGIWAAGFRGGPKHTATSDRYCPEYERPATCMERLRCCWASCTHCLWHHSETDLCFWSMLLFGQLIVLLMFLISIVLILIAGVDMFLASGCAQIYVLGDPQICSQNLLLILNFLNTFNPGEQLALPISDMCSNERLATCEILKQDMMMAGYLTVSGAIMAAMFTFMLLVESAVAHERARSRRMIDKLVQDGPEALPAGQ